MLKPLLAGALAVAAFAAPAATAATNCFGPQTMYFCLTTPDPSLGSRTECIYLGGTTCENVKVPIVELDGRVTWSCGGAWSCVQPGG